MMTGCNIVMERKTEEKTMKKKYVVYSSASYYDDFGILHFNKVNSGTYCDEESAEIRAFELMGMGYNTQIVEI